MCQVCLKSFYITNINPGVHRRNTHRESRAVIKHVFRQPEVDQNQQETGKQPRSEQEFARHILLTEVVLGEEVPVVLGVVEEGSSQVVVAAVGGQRGGGVVLGEARVVKGRVVHVVLQGRGVVLGGQAGQVHYDRGRGQTDRKCILSAHLDLNLRLVS